MKTIGIIINGLTDLKILAPIIDDFISAGIPYVLYLNLMKRGDKNYNIPYQKKIEQSLKRITKKSHIIRTFTAYNQVALLAKKDSINKLVGIELGLVFKNQCVKLKNYGIKLYSIIYLIDSMWGKVPAHEKSLHRIYYPAKHIMELYLKNNGFKFNSNRDKLFGSPIFDGLGKSGKDITILMPNVRAGDVDVSFGSAKNLTKIIKTIADGKDNVVLKTRRKQWMPPEIRNAGYKIIGDDQMYPSSASELFKSSRCVVMFYSSGIYEAIIGNNYVFNIILPYKMWSWRKDLMRNYFESDLYNFNGVVESVTQKDLLEGRRKFVPKNIDCTKVDKWIDKFVGSISSQSAKLIAKDLVDS